MLIGLLNSMTFNKELKQTIRKLNEILSLIQEAEEIPITFEEYLTIIALSLGQIFHLKNTQLQLSLKDELEIFRLFYKIQFSLVQVYNNAKARESFNQTINTRSSISAIYNDVVEHFRLAHSSLISPLDLDKEISIANYALSFAIDSISQEMLYGLALDTTTRKLFLGTYSQDLLFRNPDLLFILSEKDRDLIKSTDFSTNLSINLFSEKICKNLPVEQMKIVQNIIYKCIRIGIEDANADVYWTCAGSYIRAYDNKDVNELNAAFNALGHLRKFYLSNKIYPLPKKNYLSHCSQEWSFASLIKELKIGKSPLQHIKDKAFIYGHFNPLLNPHESPQTYYLIALPPFDYFTREHNLYENTKYNNNPINYILSNDNCWHSSLGVSKAIELDNALKDKALTLINSKFLDQQLRLISTAISESTIKSSIVGSASYLILNYYNVPKSEEIAVRAFSITAMSESIWQVIKNEIEHFKK